MAWCVAGRGAPFDEIGAWIGQRFAADINSLFVATRRDALVAWRPVRWLVDELPPDPHEVFPWSAELDDVLAARRWSISRGDRDLEFLLPKSRYRPRVAQRVLRSCS